MEKDGSRKRKLEVDTKLDSNSNKRDRRDCRTDPNGNASISTRSVNGEGIDGFETTFISDISPIISQEECVLKSSKNATTKAVTLLAKVDARERVEFVNIVTRTGDRTKLVTGLHRCIGRQGSNIGHNNVFVTALVEGDQATKTVDVGDILGYAQTFGTLLTKSLQKTVSKIKSDADFYLFPDLTTVVEATIESLNLENQKNYPIRFKSTNNSLLVIGERYTIQKGNSAKVKIKNVSEQIVALKNGDILGTAESLLSKESIEEIQLSNDESIEVIQEINPSSRLPFDINYGYVFLEIETIKASNNESKEITQIGCCTSLSKDQEKKFFKVIEPRELKHYLDNFTMAGDLLKFLHLQKNEIGQFEFRKQFEIVEEGVEVPKCISEKEALQALASYLSSFSTDCILVSISKETVKLVMERIKYYQIDLNFLKGFSDWDSILKESQLVVGSVHEFDEYYSENVSDDVSSNVHAEKVAIMHRTAVNHVFNMVSSSSSSSWGYLLRQASSPIKTLLEQSSARKPEESDSNTPPAFLEVSSSLRPNMPTIITMQTMETIEIISDEEDPLPQADQLHCKGPSDRGSTSRHNPNNDEQTSSSQENSAASPKSIQNVEPEGSLEVSQLPTESEDIEVNESIRSHDDFAPPTAPQSEPTTVFLESNPLGPLQSNLLGPLESNPLGPLESNPLGPLESNPLGPLQSNLLGPLQSNPLGSLQSNLIGPLQSNPLGPRQSNPLGRLQSNGIHSSTSSFVLAPPQIDSHCQVCVRNFSCSNGLQSHLLTSLSHKNKIKQRLNALRKSSARPENDGVLWWDLKKRISTLSSPLAQQKMHLGIEDLSMLALHFYKRGIEIVEFIQKRIFDPAAPYMAPARLVHFLGLLCKKSRFFQDLIECRIVASFVHAFRKTSDKFVLNNGLSLRIEWEKFPTTVEAKTLEELDSEMVQLCPLWMFYLNESMLK